EWVRVYGPAEYFLAPLVRELGMKFGAGAWLCNDAEKNEIEMRRLMELAAEGLVDLALIGNEVLYRKDMAPAQLAGYIRRFKDAFPMVPVTCPDLGWCLINAPGVIAECDIIGMHQYPYLDGVSIDDAIENLDRHYCALKAVSGGKEIRILETGWPS